MKITFIVNIFPESYCGSNCIWEKLRRVHNVKMCYIYLYLNQIFEDIQQIFFYMVGPIESIQNNTLYILCEFITNASNQAEPVKLLVVYSSILFAQSSESKVPSIQTRPQEIKSHSKPRHRSCYTFTLLKSPKRPRKHEKT